MTPHEVKQTLTSLSPERRDFLLDRMKLRKSVAEMIDKPYDQRMYRYASCLLMGKRPPSMYCHPRNPDHMNGPVVVVRKGT